MKYIIILFAALLLAGCETPQEATVKKFRPFYTTLENERNTNQISESEYIEMRRQVDDMASNHYTRLLAKQQQQRESAQAFAASMNAASVNYQAAQRTTYSNNRSYTASPVTVPRSSSSRYDPDSLANPYGAGSPYKPDGLMNPYSDYGSRYSNKSWTNPYATDAPKLYNSDGEYRGRLSNNQYDPDSTSNPYGKYGSKYSPDSINNPYGAGNPYSSSPIYVQPQ